MATNEQLVSRYRQLIEKGVDPQRAKSLLKQAQAQAQQVQPEPSKKKGLVGTVKDVGEGLVSFAGGIPKAIGETGILDKPAEALAKKTAAGLTKLGTEKKPVKQASISVLSPLIGGVRGLTQTLARGKEFRVKEDAPTLGEAMRGPQVGGDPESRAAKIAEGTATGLEIATGVGALAKGIARGLGKRAAKKAAKRVAKEIAELPTNKAKQIALKEGRLVTPKGTRLFGKPEPKILPSVTEKRATDVITREIKNPSKNFAKLFKQVDDKVDDIARDLSKEFKGVKVGSMTKAKAKAANTIVDDIINKDTIREVATNKELKNMSNAVDRVRKAKSLDELWDARKAFDRATPERIKNLNKATASSKDIFRQDAWLEARGAINDLIDDAAKKIKNIPAKERFKDMSSLFKAQENLLSKAGKIGKKSGIVTKKELRRLGGAAIGGGILSSFID